MIEAVMIWNEPNNKSHWDFEIDPDWSKFAAMIKLARSLNFKVIAEQVEDLSALDSARRMGVDYVQGYQVGRPVPLPLAS